MCPCKTCPSTGSVKVILEGLGRVVLLEEEVFLLEAVVPLVVFLVLLCEVVLFEEEELCTVESDVVLDTLSFQASVISGGVSGVFCEEITATMVIAAVIRISSDKVIYILLLSCGFFAPPPFFLGKCEF